VASERHERSCCGKPSKRISSQAGLDPFPGLQFYPAPPSRSIGGNLDIAKVALYFDESRDGKNVLALI